MGTSSTIDDEFVLDFDYSQIIEFIFILSSKFRKAEKLKIGCSKKLYKALLGIWVAHYIL